MGMTPEELSLQDLAARSIPPRTSRRRFSVWQVTLLVVLALVIGGAAGTLFASLNLRAKNTPGTAFTVPVIPTATPTSGAASVKFTAFSNSSFSIMYPSDWKQAQNGNNVSFTRSDGITEFTVNTHNQDGDPASVINDLTGDVLSCTIETGPASSITVNTIVWQQGVWDCFLAGTIYVVNVLTHSNSQAPDQTAIIYAAYQQVGAAIMVNFAQANAQYFQPMLQSFQSK